MDINEITEIIIRSLTYLRLGGWKVGLLLNFNVPVMKQGIKRVVLGYEDK
jgi:hypothetical protein